MSAGAAIADASGAAQPPDKVAEVATVEALPPTVCPETKEPCTEAPQCQLRNLGSVYCARWVARQRSIGAAALKGE